MVLKTAGSAASPFLVAGRECARVVATPWTQVGPNARIAGTQEVLLEVQVATVGKRYWRLPVQALRETGVRCWKRLPRLVSKVHRRHSLPDPVRDGVLRNSCLKVTRKNRVPFVQWHPPVRWSPYLSPILGAKGGKSSQYLREEI